MTLTQAAPKDVQKFIDDHLNEDDKNYIFKKIDNNRIRVLPGNQLFHMYSVANEVREFIDKGHYIQVIGFGVDHLIQRETFTTWEDLLDIEQMQWTVKEILMDLSDEGSAIDDDALDKVYAWLKTSPFMTMSMTEPIRRRLHRSIDAMWTCAVTGNKAMANIGYINGKTMMKDILEHWSDNVCGYARGVGYQHFFE